MSEAWFGVGWAWLPGTVLGCVAGLLGGLAGWLAPQGKCKAGILGTFYVLLLASAVMLAAAIVGWLAGQPYHVWYGLGLAGVIGVLVLGINLPVLRNRYRQAEERRMQSQDLN